MEEIWKDIKGYEGLYQVSSLGRVKSLKRIVKRKNNNKDWDFPVKEKIVKNYLSKRGYFIVNLHMGGRYFQAKIHRLIAIAFIPNLENKSCINHKNLIKTDNSIQNLEWCTRHENNMAMPVRVGKKNTIYKGIVESTPTIKQNIKRWIARINFNKKYIHLGVFNTPEEAALAYNKKAKELFGNFAVLNEVKQCQQ